MSLIDWGITPEIRRESELLQNSNICIGRVVKVHRHKYKIITNVGYFTGTVSGHFMYSAKNRSNFPTIGDWVRVRICSDLVLIESVIKRKTSITRKSTAKGFNEQIIASNINYVLIVFGLDGGRNFSPGAIERFVTIGWNSGATPIIALNKCDLCNNRYEYVSLLESLTPGVDIYFTSALTGEGIESLRSYLKPGITIGIIGFSGVGKSAIINSLSGKELMRTNSVRESDFKGRHTTTHKELIMLDTGGLLVDCPGIKEIHPWGGPELLNDSFEDIYSISRDCKFRNCQHSGEPDCAVQQALIDGEIEYRRFENYLDMKKELNYMKFKSSMNHQALERQKWKGISKFIKKHKTHSIEYV